MSDYHKVIGIDLGTTFSVVAVYVLGKSEVVVIPNPRNHRTTPSIVYIGKTGQISVGEAAREKLARDPGGVIIEAKRKMGERDASGGKQMISASGREFEPEFISACILRELKNYAEKYVGEPIHDAVITVPAYFKEPQKNATREAARLAGLNPRLIVNEPTAAAVAYGLDDDEDSTFIVYDFGGGTFDVSVVRVRNGHEFDILGTGGDSHLGGGDIDQLIIDWALAKMRAEHGRDFGDDAKLVGRLRIEAERVKINLCNQDAEQEFFVENPTKEIEQISYFLGPGEFQRMLRTILDRTTEQVEVAMESAAKGHGLSFDDVDAFVLVGGSSKIPYVRKVLAEKFKKPIKSDLNPDEIVAIGAARLAVDYPPSKGAELNEDVPLQLDHQARAPEVLNDAQIKDVVSHTLGIGLKNDVYDALIEKDKYIPHKVTRAGYTTAEDNQTSVLIPVYQGDNPKASLNYQLGEAVIDGLAPAPVGTHRFDITFALDADGIFFGEVFHHQTNVRKEIKLQRGQDALVAKRRVALANAVASGFVAVDPETGTGGAAGTPVTEGGDRITELIQEAQRRLSSLPFAAQTELNQALMQLVLAKGNNNLQEQGLAVLKITSVLNAHREG
jgi:molecular chaperone DnaK